jgi:hypothetical protein
LQAKLNLFKTIYGEKPHGQMGQSQTRLQNQVSKKSQLRILSKTDYEDNLLGYNPPPTQAQKKGMFMQPIEVTPKKPQEAFVNS